MRLSQEIIDALASLGAPLGMKATAYARHVLVEHVRQVCSASAQQVLSKCSASAQHPAEPRYMIPSSSFSSSPESGSLTPILSAEPPGSEDVPRYDGLTAVEVAAECRRLFSELRQMVISPMDVDFDRSVLERLSGRSLRDDAGGSATPEQIYTAIRQACRSYGIKQLVPQTIVRGPKFWGLVGRANATEPQEPEVDIMGDGTHPLAWMWEGQRHG